jgi:hypothetical protein
MTSGNVWFQHFIVLVCFVSEFRRAVTTADPFALVENFKPQYDKWQGLGYIEKGQKYLLHSSDTQQSFIIPSLQGLKSDDNIYVSVL